MLRSRHAECITMYPPDWANWGTIGEGNGPVHIANRKGASPYP